MVEAIYAEKVLLYLYKVYKDIEKKILQADYTDRFNPLVPKTHNSECQNLPFLLGIKPVKVSQSKLADFYFWH